MKRLTFSDEIRRCYFVRRDACSDEHIALRGSKAMGKGGLDHIYLIGPDKLGLWITRRNIESTVLRLMEKVPDLRVEQLGEKEAVLSAPLCRLDALCEAAGARVRRRMSDEGKSALIERGKGSRFQKRTG